MRVLLPLLLLQSAFAWADTTVFRPNGEALSWDAMLAEIRLADWVALGEEHYNAAVQASQAKVIRELTPRAVGWEFLAASQQARTEARFAAFVRGELGADQLLAELLGAPAPTYVPVLEAARGVGAVFAGVNLSREEKAPVTRSGLVGLAPHLLPPGYERGGAMYRERFEEAMQSHVPPERLENYFEAQCLTDDVMAYRMLELPTPSALVVGGFHVDYRDGVVERLRVRAQGRRVVSLRWVTEPGAPLTHPRYGEMADFILRLE